MKKFGFVVALVVCKEIVASTSDVTISLQGILRIARKQKTIVLCRVATQIKKKKKNSRTIQEQNIGFQGQK